MTTPYAGNAANNPSSFDLPDDGDDEDVSSLLPAVEGMIDKLAHVNRPEQVVATPYPLATQSVTRVQRGQPGFKATEWVHLAGLPFWRVVGTGAVFIFQPLEIPLSVFLNDVTPYVHPAGAHVGLPAVPPSVTIYEIDITTDPETVTPITLAVVDPTAGVLGNYETNHGIPVNLGVGVAGYLVVDSSKKYVAAISSEGGANALVDFQYSGCQVSWTTTGQDIGAS